MINHRLLFLFRWKYMRETHFYVVYICKSAKQEGRGGECSPPLILYIENGEGKGGRLRGKDFLFMMVSIFARISFSS